MSGSQQEQKLTGIGAQELRSLSDALKVLEKQVLERKLLGGELQQQAFSASTQVLYRTIDLYGQHIKSATISVAGDGFAALWGGGILGEVKALGAAISTDPQIEKSLNELAKAIGLAADFPSEPLSVDELQVGTLPIKKAQEVLQSLQNFVHQATEASAQPIQLPKDAKVLKALETSTPAASLTSLVPTLDIKPFETAFPLIMSGWRWQEPPSYKKEEVKKTEEEKAAEAKEIKKLRRLEAERRQLELVLDTFFQPLQAVGDQWFLLLYQCIGERPFLPKEALDVIDAFLKVYEKIEQEIFSHDFILNRIPQKFIEPYRQAIPEFRENVREKVAAWRQAFGEQQVIVTKAAQMNADQVSKLKQDIESEQKLRLPEDKAELSVQIKALEKHIQRLEEQERKLLELAEQEYELPAEAQNQLPALNIDWQILTPASLVDLPEEAREFKVALAIDCRSEFREHYQAGLAGSTSAAMLKEHYELGLEKLIQEQSALLASKQSQHRAILQKAQSIAAGFIGDKQKALEEKAPADLSEAYDYFIRVIAEAKQYQSKSVDELSQLIKQQCPELTQEECRTIAQQAMDGLKLAERIEAFVAQQKQTEQALLGQADTLIREHIQGIQDKLTRQTSPDLKEEKSEKLETVLAQLEAQIKTEETRLSWLGGLDQQITADLNPQLAKFSKLLIDKDRYTRISLAISKLEIAEHHSAQQKRLEVLRQGRYDIQMQIIVQQGDAKTIGAEYKKVKESIQLLEQQEEKLSAQIQAEEKKAEELKLDQVERVVQKTALRQELILVGEKEKGIGSEIEKLKLQQDEKKKQAEVNGKKIEKLQKKQVWLAERIPALEKVCNSLDEQIRAYTDKITPMKSRNNVYWGFGSGSTEEESQLRAEREKLREQKAKEEKERQGLCEQQKALLQRIKKLQARQSKYEHSYLGLVQQVLSLEKTKTDISNYRGLTFRVSEAVNHSVGQHRTALAEQAEKIEKLRADLQVAGTEKVKLKIQNEKTKAQLKELLEKQLKLQAERLKELPNATESVIDEVKATKRKVTEAERKEGVAISHYVSAVFAALLSEKAFEKRQAAKAVGDSWRQILESSKSARDQLLKDSILGVDNSLASEVFSDPFDKGQELLLQFQKDLHEQYNVGKDVLALLESSLLSNVLVGEDLTENDMDLWLALFVIETQQKRWQEGLTAREQQLTLAEDLEGSEPGGEAKAPTIAGTVKQGKAVIEAAEGLRQVASADIPKLTTDPWSAGLASIEASLLELDKQGEEAQSFIKAAREEIAKTVAQRASIIKEESALAEKSKAAVKKAQNAAGSALKTLQDELAAHKEQLQTAKQTIESRETALKSAVADLVASKNMASDARLAAAKNVLTLIDSFDQKPVNFALWIEETMAGLEANLLMAKQLQPELVPTLEKEVAEVRDLQEKLPAAQTALQENGATEKDKAQAAYEAAYLVYQIEMLTYYQKRIAEWLDDFEKKRGSEHFWQDGLEWVIFGLIYIMTFTFLDIKNEKAQVHEKVTEVNSAFAGYVTTLKKQQGNPGDEPTPGTSYQLLMATLESGKKSDLPVKYSDSPVKSSDLFLPTDSDSLLPRLKVVEEVVVKFSPQVIKEHSNKGWVI